MAISDIYNSLTFGGINSLDYGIYISGPGVFNAPVRDVEFVDVPGRNGAIEIDKGHWNNIEVTYKAGTFGDDQSGFAQKINAFRNAVVSQIGYQRITDTYNPEEYRLGIYASGISVDPANRNSAGEFDLVFNCKPQRYLIEGEDEITVTSGDTITNPTLYESGPLLSAEGYGGIDLGGQQITIANETYGDILLLPSAEQKNINSERFDISLLNYGDTLSLNGVTFGLKLVLTPVNSYFAGAPSIQFTNSNIPNPDHASTSPKLSEKTRIFQLTFGDQTFELVQNQRVIYSGTLRILVPVRVNESSVEITVTGEIQIIVNTRVNPPTLQFLVNNPRADWYGSVSEPREYRSRGELRGNSTVPVRGHPTFIDLEIGDAYKIENGEYIDLNRYIALPSDLPKLKPGGNEITFDNTITDLKITPRWWEL